MPTIAVWKFTSCDGCQLTLLDCEDELLPLTEHVRIAHFLEVTSVSEPGPYDISIVEGSVTTPEEAESHCRLRRIRLLRAGRHAHPRWRPRLIPGRTPPVPSR